MAVPLAGVLAGTPLRTFGTGAAASELFDVSLDLPFVGGEEEQVNQGGDQMMLLLLAGAALVVVVLLLGSD